MKIWSINLSSEKSTVDVGICFFEMNDSSPNKTKSSTRNKRIGDQIKISIVERSLRRS